MPTIFSPSTVRDYDYDMYDELYDDDDDFDYDDDFIDDEDFDDL